MLDVRGRAGFRSRSGTRCGLGGRSLSMTDSSSVYFWPITARPAAAVLTQSDRRLLCETRPPASVGERLFLTPWRDVAGEGGVNLCDNVLLCHVIASSQLLSCK